MFHAWERIAILEVSSNVRFIGKFAIKDKKSKAGLTSGLSDDEVYTPSSRRSEGRRDQLGGRCSSRAASKTSLPTLNEQRNQPTDNMTLERHIWFKKFSKKLKDQNLTRFYFKS
jgi:hypothetical protein